MAKYCGFAPDYLLQLPPQQRGIFPLIACPITMTMNKDHQKYGILTTVSLRFGSSFKADPIYPCYALGFPLDPPWPLLTKLLGGQPFLDFPVKIFAGSKGPGFTLPSPRIDTLGLFG